jgi:chromate transporter
MGRSLCPDVPRAAFAGAAAGLLLFVPFAWLQIAVIAAGAAFGTFALRGGPGATMPAAVTTGGRTGWTWLAVFFALLVALPFAAQLRPGGAVAVADKFYRAGALVFGGGHVVLPLLEDEVVRAGALGHDAFLAGYGAAQAVPGPLFTFAGYLGAAMTLGWGGWAGGFWALLWIFAPALLLVLGALPAWQQLRRAPTAQAALRGANAAVVGILLAALIDPVGRTGLAGPWHWVVAVGAFAALQFFRAPAWLVVVGCAAAGAALF